MRDSMVFYRGFYDAIKDLPADVQLEAFHAIMEYALNDEDIEVSGVAKTVLTLVKPQIDANIKRYQNGKKGGRKPIKNQTETKPKPKLTKQEPNDNVNDNVNVNVNVKNNVQADADALFEKLWQLYPVKRGKGAVSNANKRRLLDIGFDEMTRAIDRYKADLAKETWKHPKNGSTFFNSGYIDYLDANYTPLPKESENSSRKKNDFNNFSQRNYDYEQLEKDLLTSNPH